MQTEARRGLDFAGVPWGTSKKDRPKNNEGMRLKTNRSYGITGSNRYDACSAV